jgi:hypothetical protein
MPPPRSFSLAPATYTVSCAQSPIAEPALLRADYLTQAAEPPQAGTPDWNAFASPLNTSRDRGFCPPFKVSVKLGAAQPDPFSTRENAIEPNTFRERKIGDEICNGFLCRPMIVKIKGLIMAYILYVGTNDGIVTVKSEDGRSWRIEKSWFKGLVCNQGRRAPVFSPTGLCCD